MGTHTNSLSNELLIYKSTDGEFVVDVTLQDDTVWLSLNQISTLFGRDKSVISRHLKKIFELEELDKKSTVAFFATVQMEAGKKVTRQIEYYNLDAILSVGYRVNSLQGTHFRKWASRILQEHLIKGYTLNRERVKDAQIKELRTSLDILSRTLIAQSLTDTVGTQLVELIRNYAQTWTTLVEYDSQQIDISHEQNTPLLELDVDHFRSSIEQLKIELVLKGEAYQLFGQEKGHGLAAILGSIHQTFDGVPVYPSDHLRAAHLLYFIIKDHPFNDGNKRIGCLLFLLYLSQISYPIHRIDHSTLTALALLVAESEPANKETVVRLIVKLLKTAKEE